MTSETTTPASDVALSEDGRLARDLACAGCGHNLRGLPPDGRCGECGLPVHLSRGGSALGAAAPEWIAKLRWGTGTFVMLLPWLWLPLVWPLVGWACWRMAEPDPGEHGSAEWLAGAARVVLGLSGMGLATAVGLLALMPLAPQWPAVLLLVAIVAGIALFCAALAAGRLRARLAQRRLRRAVTVVLWHFVVGVLLVCPALAIDFVPATFDDLIIMIELGASLGALLLASLVVLFPLMLVRLWRELERAETLTRQAALIRVRSARTRRPSTTATQDARSDSAPRLEG